MAETKPIPVRLATDVIRRLDAASKRIGNNRAGVIRFLIDSWLIDFEKKGTASLPANWEQIMAATDHRTRASKTPPPVPAKNKSKTNSANEVGSFLSTFAGKVKRVASRKSNPKKPAAGKPAAQAEHETA